MNIATDSSTLRGLMILNNAPDYREPVLREIARDVALTVVARPCAPDDLVAPAERIGYSYVELSARRLGGIVWQPGLAEVVRDGEWDVICSSINMRDTGRIRLFRRSPLLHDRWIWWGHIFGTTPLPGLARVRRSLLRRAAGALVFSDAIAAEVREQFGIAARSFNNTQVRAADFRAPVYPDAAGDAGTPAAHPTAAPIHLLFVGRYQPRKRLERLVELAGRRDDVRVRLVGPGMEALEVPRHLTESGRVAVFGRTVGTELNEHFDWAHLVANPGHVGLLVMNTAQHGKGIVIDASSDHAPEYWLAREADQPFIDFSDPAAVDAFLDTLTDPAERDRYVRRWGVQLQAVARDRYTIEHMAEVHVTMFRDVAAGRVPQ